MQAKDQLKLLNAGFTIIRKSITPVYAGGNIIGSACAIKYKTSENHEWRVMEKGFTSKAALQRRVDELLKNDKIVEE